MSRHRATYLPVDEAHKSKFLHPVFRAYSATGKLIGVHHTVEDLSVRWADYDRHVRPLNAFLQHIHRKTMMPYSTTCANFEWWSLQFSLSLPPTPLSD